MPLKMRWLLVVRLALLLVGLGMALADQRRSLTGLVFLAGSLCLVAFLVINELESSPPDS